MNARSLWLLLAHADALCLTHQSCSQCIAEFWDDGSCAWFTPRDRNRAARCMAAGRLTSPVVPGTRRFMAAQDGDPFVLYDHDMLSENSCFEKMCSKAPACPYNYVKTKDIPCSATYNPVWRIITCCVAQANENGFIDGFDVVNNTIDGYLYYMECCPHCYPGTFLESVEPSECRPDMQCNLCPSGTYNRKQGLSTRDLCLSCGDLTCPFGQYRKRCGGAYEGYCSDCVENFWGEGCTVECASCSTARYRVGCGGTQEGTCEPCPVGSFFASPECRPCQACFHGTHRIKCMGNNPGVCARCPEKQFEESLGVCSECPSCPGLRLGCGAENVGGCVNILSVAFDGTTLMWKTSGSVYPFGGPAQTYCIADYGSGCTASDLSVGYWKIDLMRGNLNELSRASLVTTLGKWWPFEVSTVGQEHTLSITLPASVEFPLTSYFVQISYLDEYSNSLSAKTEYFSLPPKSEDFSFDSVLDAIWGREVDVDWLATLQKIDAWKFKDPWTQAGADTIASVGVEELALFQSWANCTECDITVLWGDTRQALENVQALYDKKLTLLVADMNQLDTIIDAMATKNYFSYTQLLQDCKRAVFAEASPQVILRCLLWSCGSQYAKSSHPEMRWKEGSQIEITSSWTNFKSAIETLNNPSIDEIVASVESIGALIALTLGGTQNVPHTDLPNLNILDELIDNSDPREGAKFGFSSRAMSQLFNDDDEAYTLAGIEMQQMLIARLQLFRTLISLSSASATITVLLEKLSTDLVSEYSTYSAGGNETWIQDRANELSTRITEFGSKAAEFVLAFAWRRIQSFYNTPYTVLDLASATNHFVAERAKASIEWNEFTGANDISQRNKGYLLYDLRPKTHPLSLSIAPNSTAFLTLPFPMDALIPQRLRNVRTWNVYAFLWGTPMIKDETGDCIPQSMANGLTNEQLQKNGLRLCGNTDMIQVNLRRLGSEHIFETKHEGERCFVSTLHEDYESGVLYALWFVDFPNLAALEDNGLRLFFQVDYTVNSATDQFAFLGQKSNILHATLPQTCDEPTGAYHVWPKKKDEEDVNIGNITIHTNETRIETTTTTTIAVTFGPGVDDDDEEEEDDEEDITVDDKNFTIPSEPVDFNTGTTTTTTIPVEGLRWKEWAIAAGILFGGGIVLPGLYYGLRRCCPKRLRKKCGKVVPKWISRRFKRAELKNIAPEDEAADTKLEEDVTTDITDVPPSLPCSPGGSKLLSLCVVNTPNAESGEMTDWLGSRLPLMDGSESGSSSDSESPFMANGVSSGASSSASEGIPEMATPREGLAPFSPAPVFMCLPETPEGSPREMPVKPEIEPIKPVSASRLSKPPSLPPARKESIKKDRKAADLALINKLPGAVATEEGSNVDKSQGVEFMPARRLSKEKPDETDDQPKDCPPVTKLSNIGETVSDEGSKNEIEVKAYNDDENSAVKKLSRIKVEDDINETSGIEEPDEEPDAVALKVADDVSEISLSEQPDVVTKLSRIKNEGWKEGEGIDVKDGSDNDSTDPSVVKKLSRIKMDNVDLEDGDGI